MPIVTVGGMDLAKNVLEVHGISKSGRPEIVRPDVPRANLLSWYFVAAFEMDPGGSPFHQSRNEIATQNLLRRWLREAGEARPLHDRSLSC